MAWFLHKINQSFPNARIVPKHTANKNWRLIYSIPQRKIKSREKIIKIVLDKLYINMIYYSTKPCKSRAKNLSI